MLNVITDPKVGFALPFSLKCLKHWRWTVIINRKSRHFNQGNRVSTELQSFIYPRTAQKSVLIRTLYILSVKLDLWGKWGRQLLAPADIRVIRSSGVNCRELLPACERTCRLHLELKIDNQSFLHSSELQGHCLNARKTIHYTWEKARFRIFEWIAEVSSRIWWFSLKRMIGRRKFQAKNDESLLVPA